MLLVCVATAAAVPAAADPQEDPATAGKKEAAVVEAPAEPAEAEEAVAGESQAATGTTTAAADPEPLVGEPTGPDVVVETPTVPEISSAAERFFEDGLVALQREDYATALVAFERARALDERPILLFNIAMCRRALLQYPEALTAFRQYLVLAGSEATDERRQQVRDLISQMELNLARVVVRVDQDGATVLLDGERVGTTPLMHLLQLGPGRHVLEVRRNGFHDAQLPFDVMAGEPKELVLALQPLTPVPATAPEEPFEDPGIVENWWFWTLIGVVVVGGAVTAGVLLWPEDEVEVRLWGTTWGL